MKVAIGGDHAGYELKEELKKHFSNIEFVDYGPYSADSVDYPDFAHKVANAVTNGIVDFGILICGSANGVSMAANKHAQIRAAICWTPEIAVLAKGHNNANIISLPARFISTITAIDIVNAFVNTEFEGGRHQKRIDKIPC
ncbi:MAG: ribose 5-phosphate isomerase B [Bacteroidetes bacterium]|nr:ribose 5-phosphate isomerase B [Bacteroidota bacterium]